MKDEVKENIVSDFVGLQSKMCSLVIVNNEEIQKANEPVKILLKTYDIKNMLTFCLIEI